MVNRWLRRRRGRGSIGKWHGEGRWPPCPAVRTAPNLGDALETGHHESVHLGYQAAGAQAIEQRLRAEYRQPEGFGQVLHGDEVLLPARQVLQYIVLFHDSILRRRRPRRE